MRYTVHFDFPEGLTDEDQIGLELSAETLELAKMRAAMLYAGGEFRSGAPTGYRIIQEGEIEVYRYPEPTFH